MVPGNLLEEWDLRLDGNPLAPTVVPVRTRSGHEAVLKLVTDPPDDEHLALARWEGRGAVRLHRADPRRGALLLDRLRPGSLVDGWDVEACEVVGALYGVLHRPAGRPFSPLSDQAASWATLFDGHLRGGPLPPRLVEQARALARWFARDEATDGVLVHGDLHYDHVLDDGSGPVAISPDPLSGDPHYEPAPLLWHRFDELAGDLRRGLRRRFHAVVDAAGLEEERARDWVIVRAVARALTHGEPGTVTACIAIAKAVQD